MDVGEAGRVWHRETIIGDVKAVGLRASLEAEDKEELPFVSPRSLGSGESVPSKPDGWISRHRERMNAERFCLTEHFNGGASVDGDAGKVV